MKNAEDEKRLQPAGRSDWRAWLERNHASEKLVWLIFTKKTAGPQPLTYDEAVEEALCFGWIDSIVRRLDGETYQQKFTPRRRGSAWSKANLGRARKVLAAGRVTAAGLAVMPDLESATPVVPPYRRDFEVPPELAESLEANPRARIFFEGLSPSRRRLYLGWISCAKRPETRARRIREAVGLLAEGRELGLK